MRPAPTRTAAPRRGRGTNSASSAAGTSHVTPIPHRSSPRRHPPGDPFLGETVLHARQLRFVTELIVQPAARVPPHGHGARELVDVGRQSIVTVESRGRLGLPRRVQPRLPEEVPRPVQPCFTVPAGWRTCYRPAYNANPPQTDGDERDGRGRTRQTFRGRHACSDAPRGRKKHPPCDYGSVAGAPRRGGGLCAIGRGGVLIRIAERRRRFDPGSLPQPPSHGTDAVDPVDAASPHGQVTVKRSRVTITSRSHGASDLGKHRSG